MPGQPWHLSRSIIHIIEGSLEQVDVQTTTQATVGGDDDVTHSLYLTFDEVGVLVFQVPLSDMADHLAHGFSVRTAGRHAFLRRRILLAATISIALVIF
jgi:hypothetical protein